MKLAKAKEYYRLGLVTGFACVPADTGWMLHVDCPKVSAEGALIETALGQNKVYVSLDSLSRDVERIGNVAQAWAFKI